MNSNSPDSEWQRFIRQVQPLTHTTAQLPTPLSATMLAPSLPPLKSASNHDSHPSALALPSDQSADFLCAQATLANYCGAGVSPKQYRALNRWLIEAELDLHGCTRHQALAQLMTFLNQAQAQSRRVIRIIHGRGQSSSEAAVIKPLTRNYLRTHPLVLAYRSQAQDGALVVWLRQGKAS